MTTYAVREGAGRKTPGARLAHPHVREVLLPATIATALMALVLNGALGLDPYVVIELLTLSIFAVGLNILLGLAGQVSFGHAMFYGTGAYGVAILTTSGQPFLLAVALGLGAAAVIGVVLGLGALRVRGHYLAMLTFAGGMAWYLAVKNLAVTGGVNGKGVDMAHATLLGLDLTDPQMLGTVLLVLFFAAFAGFALLRRSAFGRLLVGVKQDETLLVSAGISVRRLKLVAFVLSALLGALAGAFNAVAVGYVDPVGFDYKLSIDVVVVVALGGMGATLGPWYGAVVLIGADQLLTPYPAMRLIVFGALLLFVLLAFPSGVDGLVRGVGRRLRRLVPSAPASGAPDEPEVVAQGVSAEDLAAIVRPASQAASGGPVLAVEGVTKSYGGVLAVAAVSFTVDSGEIVAIVGPNGAGKTSLFNCVTGWMPADEGSADLDGASVLGRTPRQLAAVGIARTFQTPRVVEDLTTLDNVLLAHRMHPHGFGLDTVRALLHSVGLDGRADVPARVLTHGERKRVELVRVLLEQPRVILLDEPFAGLNDAETAVCTQLMQAYAHAGGAILFIEHDLKAVLEVSSRVVVLEFGRVIADADPQTVATVPEVIEAYLAGGTVTAVPGGGSR